MASVAVSAVTGEGLDRLRAQLSLLTRALPPPDPSADVRLWIDRCFTIAGAGTVVTATLTAGTLRRGDELVLAPTGASVRVRGLHMLGRQLPTAQPVARVAVNPRGVERSAVTHGHALLSSGAWLTTDIIDVGLRGDPADRLPLELILHIGSAGVPVRVRALGPHAARLRLSRPLPLRVGGRALLRDPGRHRVAAAVDVLDVRPPPLHRRGAARARANDLDALARGQPTDATALHLRHRGLVREAELRAMDLSPTQFPIAGDWHLDSQLRARLVAQLGSAADAWQRKHPLQAGIPAEVMQQRLSLPDGNLVAP